VPEAPHISPLDAEEKPVVCPHGKWTTARHREQAEIEQPQNLGAGIESDIFKVRRAARHEADELRQSPAHGIQPLATLGDHSPVGLHDLAQLGIESWNTCENLGGNLIKRNAILEDAEVPSSRVTDDASRDHVLLEIGGANVQLSPGRLKPLAEEPPHCLGIHSTTDVKEGKLNHLGLCAHVIRSNEALRPHPEDVSNAVRVDVWKAGDHAPFESRE